MVDKVPVCSGSPKVLQRRPLCLDCGNSNPREKLPHAHPPPGPCRGCGRVGHQESTARLCLTKQANLSGSSPTVKCLGSFGSASQRLMLHCVAVKELMLSCKTTGGRSHSVFIDITEIDQKETGVIG